MDNINTKGEPNHNNAPTSNSTPAPNAGGGQDKGGEDVEPTPDVSGELDEFVKHIDSFRSTFPLTIGVLGEARKHFNAEHSKFVEENGTPKEDDPDVFMIPPDKVPSYQKIARQRDHFSIALKTVPRSLLVALVSQYDAFLGELIKALYYLKPEILSASQRQLTFAELVSFGSIERAKDFIIEKEIETVLRKSHIEQFDWLEQKFGIELRKDLPVWPKFIEVTQRRHVFVHTNGVVSTQYLEVCRQQGCSLDPNVEVGHTLGVSRKYFTDATQCILEIGIKLAQVLWRKCDRSCASRADKHLINTSYDLISEKRYREAIVLLDFARKTLDRHVENDEHRRVLAINLAQAYKWEGNESKTLEIVNSMDWTATNSTFRLAIAVLKNDFDTAVAVMREIGSNGSLRKIEYREWPLFREFRKQAAFLKTYEEIFEEGFSIEASPKTIEESDDIHQTNPQDTTVH